uniref:DDE-1 domain-containing protein n=3 Tax=Meloidogyne TaxID=189290 RepID=A0A914NL75_MELIC
MADVCWNAPFKAKIRQSYEDWMLHGEKETTSKGNVKAPPMLVYLSWIAEAWENLSEEMIANSFKICGISNNVDGSEDDKIHVFKPTGPIPSGAELMRKERQENEFNELTELFEEVDLMQDEENGILSDNSLELMAVSI